MSETKPDGQAAEPQEVREERHLTPEEARARLTGADRVHFEGLGMAWAVLLGGPPARLIPQVVATVLKEGGTRPAWRWKRGGTEDVLMAWPREEPVRAAVLVSGPEGGKLLPVDSFPLLEGLPNDLTVEDVHPWQAGAGADVACMVEEGRNPMWFYDPLYRRDRDDLTPGVVQTFHIAGLAFSLRKALLDDLTITRGPYFEAHAEAWLREHPEAKKLDVPPLKIPMTGKRLIFPGNTFGEYQLRALVEDVEDHQLEKMPVKVLHLRFPFAERAPLLIPVYASKAVLRDYEPKTGDEVDAYVWLQGHVIDMDEGPQQSPEPEPDPKVH